MRVPVFRRISPTKLAADGFHHLTGDWTGRPMPVFEGQHIGVKVASEGEGGAMAVLLQAFLEDGTPLTNGASASMPVGKSLTYDFGLQPRHFEKLSKTIMRVTPDEAPHAMIETVIETYPGAWAMFGGDTHNPLPTEAEIAQIEQQTGRPLCDDHKRFLQTRNGINWSWWQDPAWDTSSKPDGRDFYRALGAEEEAGKDQLGLLGDATHLFGAGEGHPYLRYPDNLGDFGFYNAAFLRHGIPVGDDGGGNLFVQILGGARRGEIVFLDHEYHYGMLDDADPPQLAPDLLEGAPQKPLQDFTEDEFWDHMIEVGYAIPAATSLDAMIDLLAAYHTALIEALAPQWRSS